MRTAVACFVLAAAIATPGIVVAATSNGTSSAFNIVASETAAGSSEIHPIKSEPVDPRLRPAVTVVLGALKAAGETHLSTYAPGPETANILQLPSPGQRCPTFALFQVTDRRKGALIGSPCGHGSILRGDVEVDYTPKSLGPSISQALATLRR